MTLRRARLPLAGRGGGEMAVLEWGPADRPIDLVFLHANGFDALAYRRLLAPIAETCRVMAPDQRGHGATSLLAEPSGRRDWSDLAHDLLALCEAAAVAGAVVAGHSMGGTVALLAAAERPAVARRLCLVDPVILPRNRAPSQGGAGAETSPLYQGALRRRRRWPDRAAAIAAYRGRGAFAGWDEAMLVDYVEAGFVDEAATGVRLACAPEWEAANYLAHDHDPWAALAAFPGPVEILRAGTDSTCAFDGPAAADSAGDRVRVRTLAAGTHFMPMRQPAAVGAALLAAIHAS